MNSHHKKLEGIRKIFLKIDDNGLSSFASLIPRESISVLQDATSKISSF